MKTITIDFESFYGVGYSLTNTPNFEYIMDPRFKAHCLAVKVDDEPSTLIHHDDLQDFFDDTDWDGVTVLCQNGYFDLAIASWIYNWDFEKPARLADTKGMASLLIRPLTDSSGLGKVSSYLFGDTKLPDILIQTKEIRDLSDDLYETLKPYALQDTDLTRRVYNTLLPEVPGIEMELIDLHLRLYLRKRAMIDPVSIAELRQEDLNTRETLTDRAKETWPTLFGDSEDVLKTIRKDNKSIVAEAVKLEGKICPKKRNKSGKIVPAVAKDDLDFKMLCSQSDNLVLLRNVVMSAGSNLVQTRLKRFQKMYDVRGGWSHPMIVYGAAHTLRSGGGDRSNYQSMPKGIRRALVSPPGQSIVVADSSNIEARILAWFAGQQDVLDTCSLADTIDRSGGSSKDEGKDIYTVMAKKIGANDRALGKLTTLGLGFGMGLNTFLMNARINDMKYSDEVLSKAFHGWRTSNDKIVQFWQTFEQDFRTTTLYRTSVTRGKYSFEPYREGTALILPSGRPMIYPPVKLVQGRMTGKYGQKYWHGTCVENLVQAAARDIVFYQAMTSDWIKDRLWLLIHDELDMVEDDDKCEDLYKHACEALSTGFDWTKGLPLNGDGGIVKAFTKL